MTDEDFALLVERYLQGELNAEERKTLTGLVDGDAGYAGLFEGQVRLHVRLAGEAGADTVEGARARATAVLAADSDTRRLKLMKSLEAELGIPLRPAPRRRRSFRVLRGGSSGWGFGAAAAAGLVAIVLLLVLANQAPPPSPAQTVRVPLPEEAALPEPSPAPEAPKPPPPASERRLETPPPVLPAPRPVAPPAPPAPQAPERPVPPPTTVAEPPRTVVARVEQVQGEATFAGARRPAAPGQPIHLGDALECPARGGIGVTFPDATRIEMGGESTLAFEEKHLSLPQGTLSARVARQPAGRPMRFVTPHGEAVVLGTSLRLAVDRDSTRLEVTEGKVRLIRRSDGRSVDVPGGHFAVAAAGVELAARPLPVDEILLLPREAKFAGREWRVVKDGLASTGEALEMPFDLNRSFPDRKRPGSGLRQMPAFASFSFMADAGKEYRLWIRARCAGTPGPSHDAFAIDPGDGVFGTSCPWFGPMGENAYMVDHVSKQEGYWWVGGNERDARFMTSLRFTRPGLQTLRLYAFEGPLRIDAIWLSVTQKTRPAPDGKGPPPR